MGDSYAKIAGVVVDGKTASEYKKKSYIVQGVSLSWSMIEEGYNVLKGIVKPYGFFKDADFCQRCGEIYSNAQTKLITYNENRGLSASGEPLQGIERGNAEIMRHNNFKGYLSDVKKIYEKARIEYDQLQSDWDATQEEYQRVQREGLTERGITIAKGQFMQYEDEYKQGMDNLQKSVKAQITEIRKTMEEHTKEFYRADPGKIDAGTMVLLNSGILTTDELIHLAEQNIGNTTMLRLIGVKVNEKLSGLKNGKRDENLVTLKYGLDNIGCGEREMKVFDEVTERVMMCFSNDNSFAAANSKVFNAVYDNYVSVMDRMIAQPETPAE